MDEEMDFSEKIEPLEETKIEHIPDSIEIRK